MLIALGRTALQWALSNNPWTNVYGVARSLLAAGTAATLIFNESHILFRPASGIPSVPSCQHPLQQIGIFCLFLSHLEVARWLAVAILLVVASGWRPRFTAIPHWWISFSLQTSAITLDGGDQVTAVLTLLLLPVALMDSRRWHWQSPPPETPSSLRAIVMRLIALSSLIVIRLQVAGIYLHSTVAKLGVEEWVDGTAIYYWFVWDPFLRLPDWMMSLALPIMTTGAVAAFTWGVILLELVLFMGLVMPQRIWPVLLIVGIGFHMAIAVTMGLISFGMAMTAALVLYLRPVWKEFGLILLPKQGVTLKLDPAS
jgi:antimicrobial peptide system SdpB family protein